jgi:adenine/guanine phosphoribosyltransferase-like PRPP-binding protein
MAVTAYLATFFADPAAVIDYLAGELEPHKDRFDAIAFRGMSGAMVAPAVAIKLGKPFILVRKRGDGSHSEHQVEGAVGCSRYIIVDDLIASGETVRAIQDDVSRHSKATCVGIALWFNQCVYWREKVERERSWEARYFKDFSYPAPPAELLNGQCKALQKTATQVREEQDRFTAKQCGEAVEWFESRIGSGFDETIWRSQYPPGQINMATAQTLPTSTLTLAELQKVYNEIRGMGIVKDLTAEANTAVGPGGGPEKQ